MRNKSVAQVVPLILILISLAPALGAAQAGAPLAASRNAAKSPPAAIAAGSPDAIYLSPQDIVASPDGRTLYVAESTGNRVAILDIGSATAPTAKLPTEIPLPAPVGGLALSPDGGRLYAALTLPAGAVAVIDVAQRKVVATLPAGHCPGALVAHPDGKRIYVCNRFNNDVSVIDVTAGPAGKEIKRIAVLREPVAAAITPDGKRVIIGNHLPAGPANGNETSAAVSIIVTDTDEVAATTTLHDGATGLRGICVSPDGRYAYATHILAHYQLPTTMVERGWMCTNALSVIDVPSGKLVNTVLLDSVDVGAANPWGVACSKDGRLLVVAHAGTGELSVIDRPGLHEKLARVAAGQRATPVAAAAGDVPSDLGFLEGLRRRIKLPGKGPRGVALIGSAAYAAEYFTDSLGVADLTPGLRTEARSMRLGPDKPVTAARMGERCFNDADLCLQQWQSCASCHPDARADGLNWDLINDGLGNPKNAKSMLLAHRTPPAMISGIRDSAEVAVRAGIRLIQFARRPEAEAAAIDEYLKALRPVPSPHLLAGQLSASARRGQGLFESAGCSGCHAGELATDLKSYDVGTGPDQLGVKEFDTPTLVEVWRTAPYLYDGRATTILEVLTRFNKSDQHGATSKLTKQQLADLAEYVLSR